MPSHAVLADGIQILKATIAATVAWWIAVNFLQSELAFLAPWTALLTVHATVYQSLSRGVQTTVASAIGVGLSFLIGAYLGVNLWTFALALLVGMAGSRFTFIRDEGVAIATTAIFVLGSGFGEQAPLLGDRLIEVALGVAVGVVVNLMIIPPLRDKQAAQYVDSIDRQLGDVLIDIAEDLTHAWDTDRADTWLAETESMDREIESAWQSVRFARESRRANPRLHRPTRRPTARSRDDGVAYESILTRVGEGVSHLRNLVRTLRLTAVAGSQWSDVFRERWAAIVRDAGHTIKDPDADVEPIRDRLDALADWLADEDELPEDWPTYGALITSMRHIAVIVDDVASARGARESERENPG